MGDVVVNIRGNAEQLKQEIDSVGSGLPDSGRIGQDGTADYRDSRGSLAPDTRLIDEVRNEIQQQRGMGTKEAIENVKKMESERTSQDISDKYNARRADMQSRMGSDYDSIDKQVEIEKAKRIATMDGAYQNDPLHRKNIDQQYERLREGEYEKIGKKYDKEDEQINSEESAEKKNAEADLAEAIRALTDEITSGRGGTDPNSFLNKMREGRKDAMHDRDNAMTAEEAAAAQKRVEEYDGKIAGAMGGNKANPVFDRTLMGAQGMTSLVNGATSGSIPEMMMGASMGVSSIAGMSAQMAMKMNAVVGIAAALIGTMGSGRESNKGLLSLAGMNAATGGRSGGESWDYLKNAMDTDGELGERYVGFGMDRGEFGGLAADRIRARGTADDWYNQTIQGYGMEKSLGMKSGALTEGGQYDRYGINVTDALSRMVAVLSGIKGSGVSGDDFTRVQEKFDIQQQVMGSYMDRSDKPNYNVANNMLAAFSSVKGITQDKRVGSDMASFQDVIQNPQNDRMKALVFSSVADLFPEHAGRMDLLDRDKRDPKNEGKLIQAVLQRLKNQNGGTDTTLGYFTMKSLFPNIAPDRLDAEIKSFTNGGEGSKLLKADPTKTTEEQAATNNFKDNMVQNTTQLNDMWTKMFSGIQESVANIYTHMTTNKPAPSAPATGRAGAH